MKWQFCCRRRSEPAPQQWLRISSICRDSCIHLAEPRSNQPKTWRKDDPWCPWNEKNTADGERSGWEGFCACCKRPLAIDFVDGPSPPDAGAVEPPAKRRNLSSDEQSQKSLSRQQWEEAQSTSEERFAYVSSLWGGEHADEYVLGAMVLAWSLRKTGTPHDLVILVTDVEEAAQELLRRAGWIVKQVDHVSASKNLAKWYCLEMHFAQVFTKMHVLGLTEYSKVLMLDVDILVRQNIDDVFRLPAPAAMARGPRVGYGHGERIDCRHFFMGDCWGQGTGINAGVMLLKPDAKAMERTLAEIADDHHPEHIKGKGPEQDYLSRFYAGAHEDVPGRGWVHLDIGYNFQLHQMYFVLSPKYGNAGSRVKFFQNPNLIKVVHYSGNTRPWSRFLDEQYAGFDDEKWLDTVLHTFKGYWIWVKKDPTTVKHNAAQEGVVLGPDNRFYRIDWVQHHENEKWKSWQKKWDSWNQPETGDAAADSTNTTSAEAEDIEYPLGEAVDIPEFMVKGSSDITRMAHDAWANAYRELAAELGKPDLAAAVKLAVFKPEEPNEAVSADQANSDAQSSEAEKKRKRETEMETHEAEQKKREERKRKAELRKREEEEATRPRKWKKVESLSNPGNFYYFDEMSGETSVHQPHDYQETHEVSPMEKHTDPAAADHSMPAEENDKGHAAAAEDNSSANYPVQQ